MNAKIVPTVAALLFVGSALAFTAPGSPANITEAITGPAPPQPTFLGELAERAPALKPDLNALEAFLPAEQVTSPAAAFDAIDAVHAAYADAATPQDALRASLALHGASLPPVTAGKALPAQQGILALYATLGLQPTALQQVELAASLAQLSPARASALSTLVQGANDALAYTALGSEAGRSQAALTLLDAAAAVRPLLAATAVSASACDVFQDPLKLIWIGSPCDDIIPDDGFARLLQVDPGGNDQYYDNAGGAAGGLAFLASNPYTITFTLGGDPTDILGTVTTTPLTPPQPLNPAWQAALPGLIVDTILGNLDGDQVTFLLNFINGTSVHVEPHPDNIRKTVPVALAIDFGGNDLYSSNAASGIAQGAGGPGAVGVLWDLSGDDTYVCTSVCQGSGNVEGLGILADGAGDDSYTGNVGVQGGGSAGLLLDFGGNDHYTAGGASQGSYSSTVIPRTLDPVLFDRSGNDVYVGGGGTQGAGGQLVDLAGDDSYTAGTLSQGVGLSATGPGLLLDASGSDTYVADSESQGYGMSSHGILADLAGDDSYTSAGFGQGVSTGNSIGLLADLEGNDHYSAVDGQGLGRGSNAAVLFDGSGNDVYQVSGRGQGAADTRMLSTVAVLLDGSGNDSYSAGGNSQGSGSWSGAGLLLDLGGSDHYNAGANSQGSGGDHPGPEDPLFTGGLDRPHESGVGILLDGVSRAEADVDVDVQQCHETTSTTTTTFTSPGNGKVHTTTQTHTSTECKSVVDDSVVVGGAGGPDVYEASDFSQGSSGATGGTGLLLDLSDGPGVSTFTAGSHSQGGSTNAGLGVLVNAEGDDSYTAGDFSQGASDGGLGALVDVRGDDTYSTNAALSHGYGASDTDAPSVAVGLLVDDGGDDTHPDMDDNTCTVKGNVGVAVDAEGAAIPTNCLGDLIQTVNETVQAAIVSVEDLVTGTVADIIAAINGLLTSNPVVTPTGTIYFYDNVETTAASQAMWTVESGTGLLVEDVTGLAQCDLADSPVALTEWRVRSSTTDPQLSPNAHTGTQFWYAGNLAGPAPVAGYVSCSKTTLTSDSIDLSTATAPELRAWIAGSSESTFDFLRVSVVDETASTTTEVASYDSGFTGGNFLPAYEELVVDLSGHVGNTVHLVFEFTSDPSLPDGQGYNVDDILVHEA